MDFEIPLLSAPLLKILGAVIRILPYQLAQDGLLFKSLLRLWGTISMNQASVEMGDAPLQNWRANSTDYPFSNSNKINPDLIIAKETKKYHCNSCPLGCGGEMESEDESLEIKIHKPEYETVLSLSGLLKCDDLPMVMEVNEMLNRAGMDSISAGGTIAFAMECYENGIISQTDCDGLDLSWGNSQAVRILAQKMIKREGIGDVLADGSLKAAQHFGKGSEAFAMQAGGQEIPMHDGRNDPNFALHYAIEPNPGRHTIGSQLYYEFFKLWTKVKDLPKIELLYHKDKKYQNLQLQGIKGAACSQFMAVLNGVGGCLFGAFIGVNRFPIFEWLNAATGWQKTPKEYMEIGGRIQTLKQIFNAREGISLLHKIPNRALGIPSQNQGANKGRSVDLKSIAQAYWQAFDWHDGIPTHQAIQRFGLEKLVNVEELTKNYHIFSGHNHD